jgi:hypothetical protein
MRLAAATIASRSRVALARATALTFRRFHPELPFFLLLADEPHESIRSEQEPFEILPFCEIQAPEESRFRFRYGELELSYAATPFLIGRLLELGFDGVLFLKQETLVLDRLDPLFELLARHSILLTPHFLEPPRGRDAFTRERNVLRAGVFNGGVVAFSRCQEARRVLDWWQQKTLRLCLLEVEEGLHYEQRWLDFFPSLAPSCGIVRDPGINVGHWNLAERRIAVRDGRVTACGVPCRIFRFSGYEPHRPDWVTRYNPELRVESTGEAAGVFRRYQLLLEECGWRHTFGLPYAWEYFDNGERITPAMRRLYRLLGDEVERFGNPFLSAGEGSFYSWLRSHAPHLLVGGGRG